MTTYLEDEGTYSAFDHKVTTIAEEPEGCKFRHVLQYSQKYLASSIVENAWSIMINLIGILYMYMFVAGWCLLHMSNNSAQLHVIKNYILYMSSNLMQDLALFRNVPSNKWTALTCGFCVVQKYMLKMLCLLKQALCDQTRCMVELVKFVRCKWIVKVTAYS